MGQLENVISALPRNQSELFDVQECYPGFVAWNDFWKKSYATEVAKKNDLNPLANVHMYYENWVKKLEQITLIFKSYGKM